MKEKEEKSQLGFGKSASFNSLVSDPLLRRTAFAILSTVFLLLLSGPSGANPLSKTKTCYQSFRSPRDFARAMTEGLWLEESHRELFEFYRKNWFGNPQINSVGGKDLSDVLHVLEEHPELFKPQLREQELFVFLRRGETATNLMEIEKGMEEASHQVRERGSGGERRDPKGSKSVDQVRKRGNGDERLPRRGVEPYTHQIREKGNGNGRLLQRDMKPYAYQVGEKETFRIRSLSLQESPFRRCLGKRDCAVWRHFERAFDPNFVYFTLTDSENRSSGYITVVLGTAQQRGEAVPTAFVDRIQNISSDLLRAVLEGVRRSLAERGYLLGLPEDVGTGSRGLSNEGITKMYVKEKILPDLENRLEGFQPHKSIYRFQGGYFLSDQGVTVRELQPLDKTALSKGGFEIRAGALHVPVTADRSLSVKSLYRPFLNFRESPVEENRFQFLDNLLGMHKAAVLNWSDSYLENYLYLRLRDSSAGFKLRKKALFVLIRFQEEKDSWSEDAGYFLEDTLNLFSKEERKIVLEEMKSWKHSGIFYKRKFIDRLSEPLFSDSARVVEKSFHNAWSDLLDVNAKGFYGYTPLMLAVEAGRKKTVQLLIGRGADVGVTNIYDQTALQIAVEKGHKDIAELLILSGMVEPRL